MKKIIALGVGVLSAASLVIGATASPARAEIVTEEFCEDLAGILTTVGDQLTAVTETLGTADDALETARGDLNSAIGEWVTAAVNLVKAADAGEDTRVQEAAYVVETEQLLDAGAAWSQAKVDQYNAQTNVDLTEMVHSIYSQAEDGLCPPPASESAA